MSGVTEALRAPPAATGGALRPGSGHAFCRNAAEGESPALLTMLLEITSAFGRSGGLALTVMPLPGADWEMPQPAFGASLTAFVTGVMKCGLIHSATATRATTKPTSVTAMAGSVRRNKRPVA